MHEREHFSEIGFDLCVWAKVQMLYEIIIRHALKQLIRTSAHYKVALKGKRANRAPSLEPLDEDSVDTNEVLNSDLVDVRTDACALSLEKLPVPCEIDGTAKLQLQQKKV